MLLTAALTELLVAKDYTPRTAVRREDVLREFIKWCAANGVTDTKGVDKPLVRRYMAHLRTRPNVRYGGKLSGETQHSRASIVRMFLRWLANDDQVDEKAVAHLDMPRIPYKVVDVLSPDQFQRLVLASDALPNERMRLRDRAILSLLFDTGLRAQELCDLTLANMHLAPTGSYIQVEGKGRKEREVGLGKKAALALSRYTSRARHQSTLSVVLLADDKKKMTPNGIDRMLYRLRDPAGRQHFDGVRVSAHTMRHSYAVHYLEQGGDLYKLSRLMGHESINTTTRYLRAFQARAARSGSQSVLDNLK